MQCSGCDTIKLSNEFPTGRLSDDCDHFPSHCLRCIVSSGLSYCSDCDAAIDVAMLEDVKARFNLITQASQLKAPSAAPNTTSRHYRSVEQIAISVSLMGGDTEMFTLSSDLEVSRLMDQIAARFSIPKSKQRLMSSGRAIKQYIDGNEAKLMDYDLKHGSTLQLMKLLLEATSGLPYHNINFILMWVRSRTVRLFLDASCIAYNGTTFVDITDFKSPSNIIGVSHSGPAHSRNYHTLTVNLDAVSRNITHLFFVMSACHVSSLSQIPSPTVQLYEKARPREMISDYQITNTSNSQSAIACCMKRDSEGGWQAFSLGTPTNGYCYHYDPIKTSIARLFASGVLA